MRWPRPRPTTLALSLALAAALWLTLRATDETARLDGELAQLREAIAAQRLALAERPTAAELETLAAEVVSLRGLLVQSAPNASRRVIDRFVKTPDAAVGPPVYIVARDGMEVPLYVQFCVEYALAGATYQSCMGAPDYEVATRCFDSIVIGGPLPECFR